MGFQPVDPSKRLEAGGTLQLPPLHMRPLLLVRKDVCRDPVQTRLRPHQVIMAFILPQNPFTPYCPVDRIGGERLPAMEDI